MKDNRPTCFADLFKNVMLLSGTPDYKQRNLTNVWYQNECACSPKMAMDNGWICKPTLNLVNCDDESWPSAVKAVFLQQMKKYESGNKIFKPVMLVNCKSIDDVVKLRSTQWFVENIGKKFNFISIHSDKTFTDDDGHEAKATAEINCKQSSADEAFKAINEIDHDPDGLPVIVAQVQMIGEGINVKSFNSVITASNSDKTAMQQIGRVLRNMVVAKTFVETVVKPKEGFFNKLFKRTETVEKKTEHTFSKVNDGYADVYVIKDNLDNIADLIVNLSNYDLTDDCFDWGKRVDISSGSSLEVMQESEMCEMEKNRWADINEDDPDIIEILGSVKDKSISEGMFSFLSGDDNDGNGIPDIEEFKDLAEEMTESGYVQAWTGKKHGVDPEVLLKNLMDKLQKLLKNPEAKKLWHQSNKAALLLAFQNAEMADFMDKHLNAKVKYNLGR